MNEVTVSASKEYVVRIGSGLLPQIGKFAAANTKHKKVTVISDSNVWPLYGITVESSLLDAGLDSCHFVFPAGESSKCADTYLRILNFLAQQQLTRDDLLIALGGGVVGDITGFAAATYLRGISFIQLPTTLLAMVDSSVGGKTAIDLPAGKNLVGAFYQPDLVLCDIDTLTTLPSAVFRDGCAEIIKYAILYDEVLFSHLQENGIDFDREDVVTRCVQLKRDVVAQDEFDRGNRQLLNLGHTIGHGIEACSNYEINHGAAVGMGIAIVSRAACAMGICSEDTTNKIDGLLKKFCLCTRTDFTADALFNCALSDKKRSGGSVNLIVPRRIGQCMILATPIEQLKSFIEAGLN